MAVRKKLAGRKKNGVKKKNQRAHSPRLRGQFRFWMTTAVAILFVVAIFSLAKIETENHPPAASKSTNTAARQAPTPTSDTGATDYTFYALLKDFKVESQSTTQNHRQADQQRVSYLIQAGSFKTERQAEHRLVELKLLGLDPTIEKNINSHGERWHRILLGPYTSRSEMAHARSTMISNNIEAMVMEKQR